MPAFGYLGEPLLRSIVAYLRTLQGNPVERTLPGDTSRGKDLFVGKGKCSSCHTIRGEGGFFASDLSEYANGRSPEAVRDAILSPNKNLDPRGRAVVLTLPSGKTLEGIARNEDNFSLQLLTEDGVIHLVTKSELARLDYRKESPMPRDYGKRFSSAELDDLVNYLYSVRKQETKASRNIKEPDED
jgi:putative heme-binding domain-containing protein